MPSHYIVCQFVPDAGSDERINFGVVAYGPDGYYVRFLRSWRRVASFHDESIDFLRDFAKRVEASSRRQRPLQESARITPEFLETAATKWTNAIQLTVPRASTQPAGDVVDVLARQFLREPPRQRRARSRRYAASVASDHIKTALFDHGVSPDLLRRKIEVEGQLEKHQYDIVVGNGQPVVAALALSFQTQSRRELTRDVQVAAWSLDDVRNSDSGVSLSVVMLPPRAGSGVLYEHARDLFNGLDARTIALDDAENVPTREWADQVAELVSGAGTAA